MNRFFWQWSLTLGLTNDLQKIVRFGQYVFQKNLSSDEQCVRYKENWATDIIWKEVDCQAKGSIRMRELISFISHSMKA